MNKIKTQSISKYAHVTIDKELNKYQNVVLNSKKLDQANEIIARTKLPEKLEKELAELKEENSFWVSGTLEQADAHKNTFLITVKSDTKAVKTNFIITTLSETLNDLVKKHWGNMLTVYIKPINGDSKRPKYELLEVKAQ
jgi:predicted RNase H-like nuclease (RuvC/YqgF family)